MLFFIILGCCIGSCVQLIIDRMLKKESFILGRSYCDHCLHTLSTLQLIPIISFIIQRGKCKFCKNKISYAKLGSEIYGGVVAFFIYFQNSHWSIRIFYLLFSFLLWAISYIDYKTYFIYNRFIILGYLFAFFNLYLNSYIPIYNYVIGAFIISLPLYILSCIKKESFGGGDIKLCSCFGFFLGIQQTIIMFYIACILASIHACILLYCKKCTTKDKIAFAPYLCISMLFLLFT